MAGSKADRSEDPESFIVYCTFPDQETAKRVAHEAVERKLAACASLIDRVASVYRWKGKVETASEVLALFKTTPAFYPRLEAFLKANHPYETPEIVGCPIATGSEAYLSWIHESCSE